MPSPASSIVRAAPLAPAPAQVLTQLQDVVGDLWWTWSPSAQELFAEVGAGCADPSDPAAVVAALDGDRLAALAADEVLLRRLEAVEADRARYHGALTWFEERHPASTMQVAYLCMEYGLHESLPWYSGGLGVLAGDHLKAASDLGVPLVAVGLAWGRGYYRQHIAGDGTVEARYPDVPLAGRPVVDTGVTVDVDLAGRWVRAKIWKAQVGRVALYLLDTDVEGNSEEDRALTANLYAGDSRWRVRQEVLLGVGGVHALDALGITPTVLHLNEGHAAFAALERARRLLASGVASSFGEAAEIVRASTVFTTHTPVPAGNDRFDAALVAPYLTGLAAALGIDVPHLLGLGREDAADDDERFCMTVLALRLARHCNGVAALHGDTARHMWTRVYDAAEAADVPIRHVTNGVHLPTWTAGPIADLLTGQRSGTARPASWPAGPDANPWPAALLHTTDAQLWDLRNRMRADALAVLRGRLARQMRAQGAAEDLLASVAGLGDDVLTIGFARRMATYKRAWLLFADLDRLEALLSAVDRPVQLLFAGKAHPRDGAGNDLVTFLHGLSLRPGLRGRVFVVSDYDMGLGRLLTSGADVWLNTPVRPMEASGTSGMKAAANGVLNCSILDGWWDEAFDGANGFSLGGDDEVPPAERDRVDGQRAYEVLEREVVPAFYERDADGIPTGWVRRMRANLATLPATYSTWRMVADYTRGFYLPAHG